jgi:hypothetical protein
MKSPTTSVAVVFRQLTRARRERVMVTLHPDTVQWMLLLAAARKNCVLEPREGKTAIRLLGILQGHLESEIDSNVYHKKTCGKGQNCKCWKAARGPGVRQAQIDWQAAEKLVKILSGAKQ